MMTNFHSKHKRQKSRKFFWFLLLVLILFFYSNIISLLGGVFEFVAYPVWITKSELSERAINPLGFANSKKSLLVSVNQLKKEKKELELMLEDRNLLLKENLELKEILDRKEGRDLLLASVLAKPNISIYDSLVLDAGSNLGVKKGDRVFADGNILIGEIEEAQNKTSRTKLYSSADEKTDVYVGLNNVLAIAIGQGGGNFIIQLPKDLDIQVDDPVFVAGISSSSIGLVVEINTTPTDSFQTLLVKSNVNLFELGWVQVERGIGRIADDHVGTG